MRKGDRVQVKFTHSSHIGTVTKVGVPVHVPSFGRGGAGYSDYGFVAEFSRTNASAESHTINPALHDFNILRKLQASVQGGAAAAAEAGTKLNRKKEHSAARGSRQGRVERRARGQRHGGATAVSGMPQTSEEAVRQNLACACCLEAPPHKRDEVIDTPAINLGVASNVAFGVSRVCGSLSLLGNCGSVWLRSLCGSVQVVTPCGHFFCTGCITQWLRMHGSGRKCPVCREDLSALARKLSTALKRPEEDAVAQQGGEDEDTGDEPGDDNQGRTADPRRPSSRQQPTRGTRPAAPGRATAMA